jgi:hypothetical protein
MFEAVFMRHTEEFLLEGDGAARGGFASRRPLQEATPPFRNWSVKGFTVR